ncbi:DUF11 domain-containing protein [Fibrella forsythiae]|uniref:DUF11 domain-containing protein n=1 Tax=Fibrella forsythiae TaxID=2817061 RepID=A0ABS3JFP2_9BACT|nr:DUF11 domain-containing protein [Fibrella forsythiae]MBO0948810.1 DUF11 domain-containing protein [Fibrella forsythiae]
MRLFTVLFWSALSLCLLFPAIHSCAQSTPPFSYTTDPRDTLGRQLEFEQHLTIDPALGRVPSERLAEERERVMSQLKNDASVTQSTSSGVTWQERGPSNAGGRTRAVLFDLGDPTHKKVWAGSPVGGLWYTNDITDVNATWTVVSDSWESMIVTCLAADPSNPQIMYAGTGDSDRGNTGGGIWKTTNGGTAWIRLSSTIPGTSYGTLAASFGYIQRLVVNSSGHIFAATRYGVVRSADGGVSWQFALAPTQGIGGVGPVTNNYYYDFVSDLEIGTDNILYAAFNPSRVFRANNFTGLTWTEITPAGLPAGSGRTELALAQSTNGGSQIMYAVSIGPNSQVYSNDVKWVKKSTNGGSSWTDVTIPTTSWGAHFTNGNGSSYLNLTVHPTEVNTVYASGYGLFRSTDGGSSWITQPISQNAYLQGVWGQPANTGAVLAAERGIRWSPDLGNTALVTPTSIDRNPGYRVSETYSAAMKPAPGSPYLLGTANTTGIIRVAGAGLATGSTILDATSSNGMAFIDEDQPTIEVANYWNSYYLINGGSYNRFFSTYYSFGANPADYDSQRNVLYVNDYSPTNGYGISRVTGVGGNSSSTFIPLAGETYSATCLKLGSSKESLFVGDYYSRIYKLTALSNTAPTTVTIANGSSLPLNSAISGIDVGATDNELLVTLSNYGISSVWYTSNGGMTWENKDLSGSGLPDVPVRTGMFNPQNRKQVILGTDLGVWTTNDISATNPGWTSSNTGLPLLRVNQLRYRASDGRLIAATAGRGIFESNTLALPYTPPSISITGISNKTLCAGSTVAVSFTTTGLPVNSATNYEVWVSDSTGSFTNQRRVGTGSSSPISLTLPTGGYNALKYGTSYQFKVVAPDADVSSPPSDMMIIIGNLDHVDIIDRLSNIAGRVAITYINGSASICPSDQILLSANALNTTGFKAPIDSYQWLLNNNPIEGATSQTYLTGQAGIYKVQVRQANCLVQSPDFTLGKSANQPTYIDSDYGTVPQCNDSPAILNITYRGELAAIQWYRNDIAIAGATSFTYPATQSGNYKVTVTSTGCSVNANPVLITLGRSLLANIYKLDTTLCAGSSSGYLYLYMNPSISTNFLRPGRMSVTWYRNNIPINEAQNQNNLFVTQPGAYSYEVQQATCRTRSNATLVEQSTIIQPVIDSYQLPKTACPNDSRTLNNYGTFTTRQWQKDGVDIPGATSSYYTAQSSGTYTVRCTKGACVGTSLPVSLTFADAIVPEINRQNRTETCVSLRLDVRDYNKLTGTKIQWFKDGVAVPGATSADFNTTQAGIYSVSVTSGTCSGLSKPVQTSPYSGTKPVISATPANVCTNNLVQLGATQLQYIVQWKRDGLILSDQVSSVYYPVQSGSYSVYTSGSCGTFESDPVEIKIGEPTAATITGAALVSSGQMAVLPVQLSGPAPWSFTLNTGQSVQNTYLNPYPLRVAPSATTTYSIAAVQNACGSGTVFGQSTVTVGSGSADLTLSAQVSSRAPRVNDIVSYSLIITNESEQEATGVQVTSRLPAGVDFVDAQTDGVSVANGFVSVNVGTVRISSNAIVSYRVRITQPGTFFTAAQIAATNTPDPDSQPNSGTGDGEDDATSVDLRTVDAGGGLMTSANPNQVPLPRTQSNQPLVAPNTVELALSLASSALAPKPYDVISLSLTVSNRGGATATNMVVQTVLPTGWQLTNIAGLVVTGQTIKAYVPQLLAGSQAVIVLPVQVSAGAGQIQAQILDVNESVSNARPGNGYQNGERDEASLLLRVQ